MEIRNDKIILNEMKIYEMLCHDMTLHDIICNGTT